MQKIKTDKMLSQLGRIGDEQFKVLFFIYNTINLNSDHNNRAKIYRAVLADLTGKSERTITRITDQLVEKGLIVKDYVSDGTKLYNYYSIPKQLLEENLVINDNKTEANLVTDGRVKEYKRTESTIKNLKEQKEEKELKEELVKQCEIKLEEENVPDEEDLSQYLARMKRIKERLAASA